MSNFSGSTPKWVSRDKAGKNPAYADQVNPNLNLEKDLDTELSVLDTWKKSEVGEFKPNNPGTGNPEFTDFDQDIYGTRMGRPFLVSIQGESGDGGYLTTSGEVGSQRGIEGSDLYVTWVLNSEGGSKYKAEIPYSLIKDNQDIGHRKGLIKGSIGDNRSSEVFVIPKVKVYNLIDPKPEGKFTDYYTNGEFKFEEVYDSASVDIRTGLVTIYSDVVNPLCLVVIY